MHNQVRRPPSFLMFLPSCRCSKDVRLPVQLQRAMAAEAEAAREARAKVSYLLLLPMRIILNKDICMKLGRTVKTIQTTSTQKHLLTLPNA